MKEALHYLHTIKLDAPDFDCGIVGGSSGPAATDEERPTRPATSFSTGYDSSEYR